MKKPHINYYFIETLILGLGFFIVFMLSSFQQQIIGLILVTMLYGIMGFTHHYLHHDMNKKIMLEYIIISILVLSLFIFLKSGIV